MISIHGKADVLFIVKVSARPNMQEDLGRDTFYCSNGKDAYVVLYLSDCNERCMKSLVKNDIQSGLADVCMKNDLQIESTVVNMLYVDGDRLHQSLNTIHSQEIQEAAMRLARYKNCALYIMREQIIEIPEIFTADRERRFKLAMDTIFEIFPVLATTIHY